MTNHSKQYSSIEWTENTSKSKIDLSKSLDVEQKKAEKAGETHVTPYMHKAFIEEYINKEEEVKD